MENDTRWLLDQMPRDYVPGDGARVSNRDRETVKERLEKEIIQEAAERDYLVTQAVGRLALKAQSLESNWRTRALCGVVGPSTFDNPIGERDVDRAKAFCHACTVSENCLQYALEMNDPGTMVWAGMTHEELADLRKSISRNKTRQRIARRANDETNNTTHS